MRQIWNALTRLLRSLLLWIVVAIIIVLVLIIISRARQAKARNTATTSTQPPPNTQTSQSTRDVLAVITNSGSTNMPGSTFTIYKNGSGALTYQKRATQIGFHQEDKTFPAGTFDISQLEKTLAQIADVSTIPNHNCVKSVSFGSTTTITYQGKTSGDLSCLSNADAQIFLDLKHLVEGLYSHI